MISSLLIGPHSYYKRSIHSFQSKTSTPNQMPITSRSSANISIKEIVPFDRLNLEFPDTCPPSLVGIMSDLEYVTVIKMINDEKPKMLKKIKRTQNILTVWLIFSFTIGILIAPFVKISLHKQKKAVLKFWENVNSLLIKSNAELFEERFLRWTLKRNEANELEGMDLWNPVYCYHLEIVYDPPRVTAAIDFVNLASIALDSAPPTAATVSIGNRNGNGDGNTRNRFSSNTISPLIDLHQSESSSQTESLKSEEEGSDGVNNSEVIIGGSGGGSGDVGDISTANSLSDINGDDTDFSGFDNDCDRNSQNNQNNQNNNAGHRTKETESQTVQLTEEHAKRKEKRRIRREILLSSLKSERRDLELEREAAICRLDELKRMMMMSPQQRSKASQLPPLPLQISPSPSSSLGANSFQSPGSSSTASIIVPRKKFVK